MEEVKITINNKEISTGNPPYIIAEMSANHNGSKKRAMDLIKSAKESGADAIKIQTYKPDTITLNSRKPEFMIKGGLWDGKSLFELYEEAHLPWDWHQDLFNFANELGITIFSSPFDHSAVDLLESLGAPAYKIASFEATDLPLIEYVASTGKPIIISTGMANLNEITEAVETARSGGCTDIAVLHCVSGYPAPHEDYNLLTLKDIQSKLNVVTGLSDHTVENTTAIASISLGSSLIEKHFTLKRSDGGPDSSFSLEPDQLRDLCIKTKSAWEALGKVNYEKKSSEIPNIQFRRSLYYVKDLQEGDIVSADCIKSVRPGNGMHPKLFKEIIGKKLIRGIEKHSPVQEEDFIP
tara:strand:- start:18767 stop:19822 length:1056 start_codon:yes stop_codon:yes gene_type:complete